MHGRTETILKSVVYYEFVAVIDKIRVKVIVKRIEDTQPFFWSIIPYWQVDKATSKRKLHSGYPEQD